MTTLAAPLERPVVFCVIVYVAEACETSPVTVSFVTVTLVSSLAPVSTAVEHSAYSERILASSVASLAFSSWLVKIGIEIATRTPVEIYRAFP
mgnify:CR=1 FL=1